MKKSNKLSLQAPPPLDLAAFTALGFFVSRAIDDSSVPDISYKDLFDAAADKRLIAFLAKRYSNQASLTFVTQPHRETLPQMEIALSDAAAAYDGRVGKATGPRSGLCMLMTIIFEAIQQQFRFKPSRLATPKHHRVSKLPTSISYLLALLARSVGVSRTQ